MRGKPDCPALKKSDAYEIAYAALMCRNWKTWFLMLFLRQQSSKRRALAIDLSIHFGREL
jgi:hypothetical protein